MTYNHELTDLYSRLRSLVDGWTPGDLMGLASVKAAFEALMAHSGFSLLPKPLVKGLRRSNDTVLDLLDGDEDWKAGFLGLEWPAPVVEAPSQPAEPASPPAPVTEDVYPNDYFSQVIADPNLLSQLCDEVKEHLDAAQFSLVDLERDPENAETVNRVFRSFHTLKSSAAFLGLKNIEEVAHVLEDLLVLVRDGKLGVGTELTDVIFRGIGLLRDLAQVIETANFQVGPMVEIFRHMRIFPFVRAIHSILENYQHRKLGEILLESGLLTPQAVERILETQKAEGGRFGEIAVAQRLASPQIIEAAVARQAAPARKATYVKVLNERLNALVDMVGELVVNQSMLRVHVTNPDTTRESAERAVAQLESVTTTIKNLVLSMGMVSVAEVFNKLRVIIRNTAAETGKLVAPEFHGEDTELDRNIIETIYDPLVHLVRNAIDHGLESPEDRERAHKPPVGQLKLRANHRGNGIEITIEDDGAGVDRSRVVAKALSRGLITEAQVPALKDKDILDLLFLPGFSTRDVATEISGRGVGLDVVRQNISQVHGKVDLESTPGQGCLFTVRIPLTLAIIDGFVAVVDQTKYVFPFSMIEEILVPQATDLRVLDDGNHLVFSRGKHIPVLMAGTLFDHKDYAQRVKPGLSGQLILLLTFEERTYGVVVDGVVGKQEIVIKSLTEALAQVSVFSGGTIFGDGDIGFVVDVEELIQLARKGEDEDLDRG